jgi:hypothetical protein
MCGAGALCPPSVGRRFVRRRPASGRISAARGQSRTWTLTPPDKIANEETDESLSVRRQSLQGSHSAHQLPRRLAVLLADRVLAVGGVKRGEHFVAEIAQPGELTAVCGGGAAGRSTIRGGARAHRISW